MIRSLIAVFTLLFPGTILADTVFMLGNSLTWDTRPWNVDDSQWHVYCNKNLKYIQENPTGHCISSSLPWTIAMTEHEYDKVVVQPYFGTTLSEDVQIITGWMDLQPQAEFVLHTGWTGPNSVANFFNPNVDVMQTSPTDAYFNQLEAELAERRPGQKVTRTQAGETLFRISQDIDLGQSPFDDIAELYRDSIHMSYTDGRYLMNNLMRLALDQPLMLDQSESATARTLYLNQTLQAVSVPEPSCVLVLVIGVLGFNLRHRTTSFHLTA